jgi:dTDP-L-rhamnose 4-epimerase
VTVFDNLSPQIHGDDPEESPLYLSLKEKVKFIRGDVRNRKDLENALKGQDIVVHLAAETGTGQSMYEIANYTDVNIQGTALLLDVLTNGQHAVKKLVLASSRAVYGEGKYRCKEHGYVYPPPRLNDDLKHGDFQVKCPFCLRAAEAQPTDENSLVHPSSIYGITKQVQEQLLLTIGEARNIPTIVFRYQNVYGPGQSLSNPYTGILSIFATRIKNGNEINIFEDGKESRDFVYIDDVIEATIAGIESELVHGVCNVGSGVPTDVLTVAKMLTSKLEQTVPITVSGNYRLGDIRHNYADLVKIESSLQFQPKYDFDTGISKFVQWVNQQEIKVDGYEKSIEEMKKRGLYK